MFARGLGSGGGACSQRPLEFMTAPTSEGQMPGHVFTHRIVDDSWRDPQAFLSAPPQGHRCMGAGARARLLGGVVLLLSTLGGAAPGSGSETDTGGTSVGQGGSASGGTTGDGGTTGHGGS